MEKRKCKICKDLFSPTNGNAKCCSIKCSKKNKYRTSIPWTIRYKQTKRYKESQIKYRQTKKYRQCQKRYLIKGVKKK